MAFPELYWFPPNPEWNRDLRAIGDDPSRSSWDALVALANAPLDSLGTLRLDRKLTALFPDAPPPGLETRPVRVAVLASSTADHLPPGLRVAALRRGIWLKAYVTQYGGHAGELMDAGSGLHAFRPDLALFALDARHLLAEFDPADPAEDVDQRVECLLRDIAEHWRRARAAFDARVVQQTLAPVFPLLLGNNEHRLPGSPARLVARLNEGLRDLAETEDADLLALDARVVQDGLAAWHDPALWHRAKQEVHPGAAHLYGDLFGRLLAARQGRSRKCLVLDLDNTLWGGVIGDDRVEGIVLGQGEALGEAFVAFQQYARSLARRGVILAVCSKNDEANALEPFDRHPEMILRRSDIACFAANWTDKAANIREVAGRLNIGLDSLVFVDDNPAERAIVRCELPMVAVPELPADPALYAACLADAGYFEGARLTEEDRGRVGQYRANLARRTLAASATDLDGYLASLDMEARWGRFDAVCLPRVVQLINKTNQFNLTTRRATEEEVSAVIADPRALTIQARLLDRFGDNGIIAVVSGRFEMASTDLLIETWLMSCRVLGRGMEQAMLNLVVAEATRLGATRLIGEYRPTARNGMVREHYARLGFAAVAAWEGGITRWSLSLAGFTPLPSAIRTVGPL